MEPVLTQSPVSVEDVLPIGHSSVTPNASSAPKSPASDFLDRVNLNCNQFNRRFEQGAALNILAWAIETFGQGLSIGTSFGASGIVLMDLALQISRRVDIFYIDTGYFFPETYTLIDRLQEHYQRDFRVIKTDLTIAQQAKRYGPLLYQNDPNLCCHVRKVLPMHEALAERTAWATALRHDQASTRANTPVVQWNMRYKIIKVAPLVHWTEADIWQYIHEHGLPYNELHEQGYPSISCWPCTQPVKPGEDLRAGRWQGFNKTECGLHLDHGNQVAI
ncbi:MAG: phosphoadenylyl-sulfate reductase [Caldilineaceae bacterium]